MKEIKRVPDFLKHGVYETLLVLAILWYVLKVLVGLFVFKMKFYGLDWFYVAQKRSGQILVLVWVFSGFGIFQDSFPLGDNE